MAKASLFALVVLELLLEDVVPPSCESDQELEYLATLLVTERTPVTHTCILEVILRLSSLIYQAVS